jgi:hypothetical protein
MKKKTNAGVFLLIIVLILAAVSVGGYFIWNHFFGGSISFGNFETETRDFYSEDPVQVISIENKNSFVKLTESDDGNVHVKYAVSEAYDYDVELSGGVLTIVYVKLNEDQIVINGGGGSAIEVAVPNTIETADINTSNAFVTVEDLNFKESLSINTSNGFITANDISAGSAITVKSSNAAVNIDIDGKRQDYSVVENSEGEHTIGTIPITVKTSNGPISVEFDD